MSDKEKSIIFIVGAYYPLETGFSSAFQNIEKAILKEKCIDKVYVLAPYYSENPNIDNLEYTKLKKGKFDRIIKGLFYIGFPKIVPLQLYKQRFSEIRKRIDEIINQSDVQFILIESMFLAWCVPLIKGSFNIPVMVRIHGTGPETTKYLKDRFTNMNRAFLDWTFESKYISATTPFYFDFFQEYWNDYNHFMNKYFFIIPNTADIEKKEIAKKNEIIFMQLGRMDSQGYHQKGFTDTVQALLYLEETLEEEMLKRIRYISVGSGENESEFKRILSCLKFIKTEHYNKLTNEEVKLKVAESDVIVIPSRCEGMSMFATEALAVGRAFVYTDNNGLREMIRNRQNGIAIKTFDYLSMASAIRQYVENPDLIIKYGKRSREIFEEEYTYEKVAKKFMVALNTITTTHN